MSILTFEEQIEQHRLAAEQAKTKGEYEVYWQERRAMLLAQAKLREIRERAKEPLI